MLASWLYIALIHLPTVIPFGAAIIIFFAGLISMRVYDRSLQRNAEKFDLWLKKESERSG